MQIALSLLEHCADRMTKLVITVVGKSCIVPHRIVVPITIDVNDFVVKALEQLEDNRRKPIFVLPFQRASVDLQVWHGLHQIVDGFDLGEKWFQLIEG